MAADDQTLRLWEVATGQELRTFTGHTNKVRGCAFGPDGRYALSASDDHTLRLWEVATGTLQAIWHGEAPAECCAFSPLGDRVLAGDGLGGVHLFVMVGVETSVAQVSVASQRAAAPDVTEPGPVASSSGSTATSAPPVEAKPRRKRFWLF